MTMAFWCVFIAALLPYVPFGLIKGLDQKYPRAGVSALTGRAARAHAAHLNAFEAFGPFAAAVVIEHLSLGANTTSNLLALAFIAARIAHIWFYISDMPPARSGAFTVGLLLVAAMFLHAAFA